MSTIVRTNGQTRCFSTTGRAIDWAQANGNGTVEYKRARPGRPATKRDQSEDYCRPEDVLVHFYQGDQLVTRRAIDCLA